MNEIAASLCAGLFRTTLILTAAAVLLPWLLRAARCRSAAAHRFGLCLVLLQGWMMAGVGVPAPSWWPAAGTHDCEAPVAAFETASRGAPTGITSVPAAADWEDRPRAAVSIPPNLPADGLAQTQRETADAGTRLEVWLAAVWLLGLLLGVVRWTVHYARLVRGLPAAGVVDDEYAAEWQWLQDDNGVRHAIPLQQLPGLGPMLVRLPRGYRLIVPAELWGELSREQRLAILRHELAHVTRRDVWKSLAVRVLALPHWFNPLAWRTVRLFDECAEWACDEAVRRSSPQQTAEYARALLFVGAAEPQSLLLSPAAGGRSLSLRIRRVLASDSQEDSMMKKTLLTTLVTGLALFGLVRFQTVADDTEYRLSSRARRADDSSPRPAAFSVDTVETVELDGRNASRRQRRRSFPGDEAVIDMSHIFKNLDEFERGRTRLRDEVAAEQEQAQRDRKAIVDLQRRLQALDGEPESRRNRESLESDLDEHKARLESRTAAAQRRFLRDEADLYYATYRQVTDEVRRYAREHGIRIVRRFNRGSGHEIEPDNPKAMLQLINRDVVFVEEPTDITTEVLERLNRRTKGSADDESR